MPLIILLFTTFSTAQSALYFVNEKFNTNVPKSIFLLLIVLGHVFIFPVFLYPVPSTDGVNCGMPIIGITLIFWIFGTASAFITHMIWNLANGNKFYK